MRIQNKKSLIISSILLIVLCLVLPIIAHAAPGTAGEVPTMNTISGFFGTATLAEIITRLIQFFLGLLGLIAVVLLMYGGFIWMTAAGEPDKVEKAKRIIYQAIIGLIIIFSAFAIASFLFAWLSSATGNGYTTDPCDTVGEERDCSALGCDGTQRCGVTGFWSNCAVDSSCNGSSYNDKKYATFIGFTDPNVRSGGKPFSFSWIETKTQPSSITLPKSPTLQVSGFAHNTDTDTIGFVTKLTLFKSTTSNGVFDLVKDFDQNYDVGTDDRGYSFLFASTTWNSLVGYEDNVATTTYLQVGATNQNPNDYQSKKLKAILRPAHCFNGVKDDIETDIDCGGGGCGSCPGESCNLSKDAGVCQPNTEICRFGSCDNATCLCPQLPVINYISPATDPNGDTDFNVSETWVDDVPNGAPKNLITIWGKNFGTVKSLYQNVLTNINFESGEVGKLPTDWFKTNQSASSVGITEEEAYSGTKSVKIYRALNQPPGDLAYPGVCSQDLCLGNSPYQNFPYKDPGCKWDDTNKICDFTDSSSCGDCKVKEGSSLGQSNKYDTVRASLYYDIAKLRFEVGQRYVFKFKYKGVTDVNISAAISANPGWSTQAWPNTFDLTCIKHGGAYCSSVPERCRCSDAGFLNWCCVNAPIQTKPYAILAFNAVNSGTYSDWQSYEGIFTYTSAMNDLRDKDNNVLRKLSLTWGYPYKDTSIGKTGSGNPTGNTGIDGTELFIDDVVFARTTDLEEVRFCGGDENNDGNVCDDGDDKLADFPSSVNDKCTSNWTNNQIIVAIPEGAVDGPVRVTNEFGLSDMTNDGYGPPIINFDVNDIKRPGICAVEPDHGIYPEATSIYGNNFPTVAPQSVVWKMRSYDQALKKYTSTDYASILSTAWTEGSVIDTVPENMTKGKSGIRIFNGELYSNYFNFMVSAGTIGDPCGLDPLACKDDKDTCNIGLACDNTSCTCQISDTKCTADASCNYGGCPGTQICAKGILGACQLNKNSTCVPYFGIATSTNALFSWAFTAKLPPIPPKTCLSILWGDGSCDLNGCLDANGNKDKNQYCDIGCVCKPITDLCVSDKVRVNEKDCPTIVKCKRVQKCIDSHWTSSTVATNQNQCVNADPNCSDYILIPTSTVAVFSWAFTANNIPPYEGPYVVTDCSGTADCSNSSLPSPSPWSDHWDNTRNGTIVPGKELACVNAVIGATFSHNIDQNTLTSSTIQVYMKTSTMITFEKVVIEDSDIIKNSSDLLKFNLRTANFETSTDYKVFLSYDIKDQLVRNLVDDKDLNGVRGSNCATTTGVCWTFKTRGETADKFCDVGCINCSPNGYFNRYYGQQKLHSATPLSEDNTCIMLDGGAYKWDWAEQEQEQLNWVTNADKTTAYSYLHDFNPPFAELGNINTLTNANNFATTTALNESNWRINNNFAKWFELGTDNYFFRINAIEKSSGNPGNCAVHNDFTNPIVIENQRCTKDEDPAKRILQSPSPWKNQQDACLNASILVLFSRNMNNTSLMTGNNVKNIEIYKCSTQAEATSTSGICTGGNIASAWIAKIFNHNNQNITMQMLQNASPSVNDSVKSEGIAIYPDDSPGLEKNTWYKVVIKGGLNGVRGASTTPTEVADGVLQIPSSDARFNNGEDYYWYFKTGAEKCPIDNVNVLPQMWFMPVVNLTQEYVADPYAANCNHLNPFSYTWAWNSVINPYNNSGSGCADNNSRDIVATICDLNKQSCTGTDYALTAPFAKAFGQTEGNTKIKARAIDSGGVAGVCANDKFGYGDLQIGYGGFTVTGNNGNNNECLNNTISATFSREVFDNDLNDDINLYLCDDAGENCTNDLNATMSVNGINKKQVDFTLENNLTAGTTYRAVIMGGANGVKSVAGTSNQDKQLINLNYSFVSNLTTECDTSRFPWRVGDVDFDLCDNNSKKFKDVNLCTTASEQCNNHGLVAYYDFNSTTTEKIWTGYMGNLPGGVVYVNGISDKGLNFNGASQLDLSSQATKVSNTNATISLWVRPLTLETTNTQNTFFVASTTNGQQLLMDSKKTIEGGARFRVLYGTTEFYVNPVNYQLGQWYNLAVTASTTGNLMDLSFYIDGRLASTTKNILPITNVFTTVLLGNSSTSKYFSGDMDELAIYNRALSASEVSTLYSSKAPQNVAVGCDTKCHNTKLQQKDQFDSYSWTFKLSDTAKECKPLEIDMSPCPNGIWSVTADRNVSEVNVKFYKGFKGSIPEDSATCFLDADINKTTFWRRAYDNLVKIVKNLMGIRSAIAADYWCLINTTNATPLAIKTDGEVFDQTYLNKMKRGNATSTIFIDYKQSEVIGYSNDSDKIQINFINSSNYEADTEYKTIATYGTLSGIKGTSTATIMTSSTVCKINSVRFDVWPRGQAKDRDAFFCYSDPLTGKPDDCGRYSPDLYDDDMSASWTEDKTSMGYNIQPNGGVDGADWMNGNQHLIRAWALDKNGYMLRATNVTSTMINMVGNGSTTVSSMDVGDMYAGDFWLTSGSKQGRSILTAVASDYDAAAGIATSTLPIYTFFCNNPWPSAEYFPYYDGLDNCNSTSSDKKCINSNFGTYYCRDAGQDLVCGAGTDKLGQLCQTNESCWIDKGVSQSRVDLENSCKLYQADDLPALSNDNSANIIVTSTTLPNLSTGDAKMKEFLFTTSSVGGIGIRVYDNNNHYSPMVWYKKNFNDPNSQGSLSQIKVDGNSAVSEGRTVYVNAPDYGGDPSTPATKVYSTIYLMSYNQNAGKASQNIFGQMVNNWFFNASTTMAGGLEYDALGNCSIGHCKTSGNVIIATSTCQTLSDCQTNETCDKTGADNKCYTDLDCLLGNKGYCESKKAQITRDNQRLADIQDIYQLLDGFNAKWRCSNDFSRSCPGQFATSSCYGGGHCGNFYPNLAAGTFIVSTTFSVWPSWQDNLAKELGARLPVDPINQLWASTSNNLLANCAYDFDSNKVGSAITCWDQTKKRMATSSSDNTCGLSGASAVYEYLGNKYGTSAKIYAKSEAGGGWNNDIFGYDPFEYAPSNFCRGSH